MTANEYKLLTIANEARLPLVHELSSLGRVGIKTISRSQSRETTELSMKEATRPPASSKKGPSGEFVKPLKTSFERKGLQYRQFCRNEKAAIYEVIGHGYEVVKIRISKAGMIDGRVLPACERYASDAEFGIYGWYYGPEDQTEWALQRAKERYNSI